jgi:hypothetical protein
MFHTWRKIYDHFVIQCDRSRCKTLKIGRDCKKLYGPDDGHVGQNM